MTESIKYPDAQQLTVHGRIAFLEEAEHEDRTFLAVKVYTTISDVLTVAIRFGNSNGLLTAYRNGNLQVGQELTLMGRITGMRAFYTKEEDSGESTLVALKNPEWSMSVQQYIFGSKPQPKADKPFSKELTPEQVASL